METEEREVKEDCKENLSAEVALYDVLDKIFTNLSLKDLLRAAAVCKSWQYIADIEISKRNEIETLILPVTYGSDDEDDPVDDGSTFQYLQNKWHVSDSLRSLPRLVLLFIDDDTNYRYNSEQFYFYYYNHFGRSTRFGVFDVLAISMDSSEILAKSNLGVGISIPSTPKLKVDYYVPYARDIDDRPQRESIAKFIDETVNRLFSTENEHNCFIYLSCSTEALEQQDYSCSRAFLTEFANVLKERCKPGAYSLWGGEVTQTTAGDLCGGDRHDIILFFIIRISGPALNSWSIVLKSNLSATEAKEKLLNLKKTVNLKSHSVAIAMVPSNKSESFDQKLRKTEIFRKVFPKVSLLGIYENENNIQIGVNSMDCDSNPVLEHKNSIAYLIITTD